MDHHYHHNRDEKTSINIAALSSPPAPLDSNGSSSDNNSHINDIDYTNNKDPLDNIDPINKVTQISKQAGRIAGQKASYEEGHNIGIMKGWEIGLELGFMFRFCSDILIGLKLCFLQKQQTKNEETNLSGTRATSASSSRLDRCVALANDVVKLINEFPSPQHLLLSNINSNNINDTTSQQQQQLRQQQLDVSTSLQRIRAKFKLLNALLKTKQSFDIQRVLVSFLNNDESSSSVLQEF
jgi:hypothetical protein